MTAPSAPDIAAEKAALRRLYRTRRDSIPPEQRVALSAGICAMLPQALPGPSGSAPIVAAYFAVGSELSLAPFIRVVRACGAHILLPRWCAARREYGFAEWLPGAPLLQGKAGIPEPPADAPAPPPESIAAAIVPGVAFTSGGARLGYGGGWYDRMLSAAPQAKKIGVCFPCQIAASLPCGPHDIRMDTVVSAPAQRVGDAAETRPS